jgi:hypothetical protein
MREDGVGCLEGVRVYRVKDNGGENGSREKAKLGEFGGRYF